MHAQDTFARVRRIIAANREISEVDIHQDSRLVEDLDIDSLAATEIVFDVEEEFSVVVPEQHSIGFATVADLCAAVEELVRPPS